MTWQSVAADGAQAPPLNRCVRQPNSNQNTAKFNKEGNGHAKQQFIFNNRSVIALLGCAAVAQAAPPNGPILFTNVNVFDGVSEKLIRNANVVVTGNIITAVSTEDLAVAGGRVIDGGGRTLMPGLSDTHVHLAFSTIPIAPFLTGDPNYNVIFATRDAEAMLMRGVTSVRDMGGNVFGMKQAIDEGLIPGPRFGGTIGTLFLQGHGYIADGVPEVLAAARENLRHGASQIKVMTGGGYSSPADPLTDTQYTVEEIKAAVDVARNWDTYVTIHAYTVESINQALDAGVRDVGHGQLLDKETLQRMAKEGVFLSTQPFTECSEPQLNDFSNAKLAIVCKGTEFVYKTAREIPKLKLTYGTDMFNLPQDVFATQVKQMERLLL
jgi:imidazolonepropionase-like amidohydrolase